MTKHVERTLDSDGVRALAGDIDRLGPRGMVAFDTETTGFHPYTGDYITGMSLCLTPDGRKRTLVGNYIPIGHHRGNVDPEALAVLFDALNRTEATHALHHCTFDWPFLANLNLGFEPGRRTVDTQIMRWLDDENAPKKLKVMGEMYLDADAKREQDGLKALMAAPYKTISEARAAVRTAYPELRKLGASGKPIQALNEFGEALVQELRRKMQWSELSPDDIGTYAARDASLTSEIGDYLVGRTGIVRPGVALKREMELQPILYAMTKKGVGVDSEQLHAAGDKYQREAEALETWFKSEFGVKGMTDASKRVIVYDKLGLPCLMKTPGGERSVAVPALEQLQGHPVVAKVMEYGHLIKARTAYADPFAAFADASLDGRIHGKYSSDRTVTGRLAASGPNVTTIPRMDSLPDVRRAFFAVEKGYERLGFDLASAELWVTASLTGDPVLISALQEGRNLHVETMLAIFGGEPDKHRREYTLSKNVNYGSLYEAGVGALSVFAAKAGYAPDEAREVAFRARDGHRKLFAKQHAVADWLAQQAQVLGKLPLHVEGRYRHFQSPFAQPEYYTALNALVQGGVAEFMKDTMIEVFRAGYGELLVLQVHDELVFDAPIGMHDELQQLLTDIALDLNPFKFPMLWDGKAWAEEEAA